MDRERFLRFKHCTKALGQGNRNRDVINGPVRIFNWAVIGVMDRRGHYQYSLGSGVIAYMNIFTKR